MKPMNWISATGRMPCAARPMLMPAISVSASGVSITRSGPKRSSRPAVARNTPPFTPTSSPRTTTRSSAAISYARARVTASTRVISATARAPRREVAVRAPVARARLLFFFAAGACARRECFALRLERRGQTLEKVIEHRLRRTDGGGEVVGDRLVDGGADLCAQRRILRVAQRAFGGEKRCQALQRVERTPARELVFGAVAARVVGGRMVPDAIGQRLDHVRAFAGACLLERARHRGVHGDQVVAVDLLAFDAGRDGLLGERIG